MSELNARREDAAELLAGGHDNGCAVVLVCLADLYRECGEFELALECSLEAQRHFRSWAEIRHRHNHAVALYSTGLAHQFIGSEQDALDHYDLALEVFSTARVQWILDGKETWRKHCDTAMRWLEKLRQRLVHVSSQGKVAAEARVLVPVLSSISAGEPMLASEDFDEWIEVDLQAADRINFALRVKGDSMVEAKISPGDLALIEQNQSEPPNGTIVAILIDRVDEEATLKRFYRETDHIRLEPANASYPVIILKDDAVRETGIRERYEQSHPEWDLKFYPGVDPRIVGRVRDVVSRGNLPSA